MYSGVATGIFAYRNANKTANENIGRLPVTVAQSAAVLKAGAQYDNAVSKQAKVVLNTLDEVAKTDKVFRGLTKVVKFAENNVNPLIVASSGLNVLTADKKDRKKTLISESGCLAGMFVIGSISASTLGQKIGEKVADNWDKPLTDNNLPHQKINYKA